MWHVSKSSMYKIRSSADERIWNPIYLFPRRGFQPPNSRKKKAETTERENSRVTDWETRNWVTSESQSATCEQWPSWWTTTTRSPSPTWSYSGSARSGRRGAKRRRLRRRRGGICRARAADNWSAPSPDPKRCRPSRDRFCRLAGGSGSTLPIAFTSLVRRRFELFMFLRFYHFRLKFWFFWPLK